MQASTISRPNVVAAAAGGLFAMTEPFEFSIDPADLLDDVDADGSDANA